MYIHHWFQATVDSLLHYSSEGQNQKPRLLNVMQMDVDIINMHSHKQSLVLMWLQGKFILLP